MSKARTRKAPSAPVTTISNKAAKAALERETKIIARLQKDTVRNAWQIGKRLAQVVELELFKAGGFATVEDYAEKTLRLARSTAFQYMRIAQSFSEEVAATFGIEKLDRGLAYIAKTKEDEKPKDIPKLKIRVPNGSGKVHAKTFETVTLRELRLAVRREAERSGTRRKSPPAIAAHAERVAVANRALDRAVGKTNADRADVTLRAADGELLVDVRGVPLVHVAKALAAVGKALG